MAKLIVGVTDLATTHPDLVKEWDYEHNRIDTTFVTAPTEVTAGSHNKVWWLCPKGHSYNSQIADRVKGTNCPYCSGNKVLQGYNDLATTHPDLAKEWDTLRNSSLKPTDVPAGSNKKVYWLCPKGHSFESIIANRTKGRGCPYCSIPARKVLKGFNDLQTTNPDLTKEWDIYKNSPLTPTEITAYSNKKVWWICKEGHSYQSTVFNRANGTGCPYCAGKRIQQGYNDLQSHYPDLAKEWDFEKNTLKPTEVTVSSSIKAWWVCKNGHSFDQTIASRTRGQGCPYCSGYKAIIGVSDVATTNPELIKEYSDKNNIPIDKHKMTDKVWWKCSKCSYEWQAEIHNRKRGRGCPECAKIKRAKIHSTPKQGESLADLYPELIKEWDYNKNVLKPTEVKPKSRKKVYWVCKKGHSFEQAIQCRTNGTGCPTCSGSHSERLTGKVLKDLNIKYKAEWVQKIGITNRRYDFYLPDLKLCIEIDGQPHFEECSGQLKGKYTNQKRADTQKNNHLLKLSIPLLRIPGLDTFNVRLQEINQPKLDETQFKLLLTDLIKQFISTRKIPDEILSIYESDSETNYYQVALQMNKL